MIELYGIKYRILLTMSDRPKKKLKPEFLQVISTTKMTPKETSRRCGYKRRNA